MRGINKVILIGNTGKDPEYKTLQDGTPVAKLTLATTESFRLKSGEAKTSTTWHTIILWRGLANLARDHVRKGSLLYIEGKLTNRNYEDADGQKKYVTEVVAGQVLLLDKRQKDPEEEPEDGQEDRPLPF